MINRACQHPVQWQGNFLFKKFYHILGSQSQKEDGGPKKRVDNKWALKVKKAWRWLFKKNL